MPRGINCVYIRQAEPLGLGHAVLCARQVVGNEPFAILLADDLMQPGADGVPVLKQMVDLYARQHASVLAVQEVSREETTSYGIVSCTPWAERTSRITGIVEKPKPENAPSTLAVVGRYLLSPMIFEHLANLKPGAGGEIQLTDALAKLVHEQPVLAYNFEGRRYDCGSKLGYLQATVELGLQHPEVGPDFKAFLKTVEPVELNGAMIGIIGGSGLAKLVGLQNVRREDRQDALGPAVERA